MENDEKMIRKKAANDGKIWKNDRENDGKMMRTHGKL